MIVEEFYIDGQRVDIKDVSIVRSYKSPYFGDVTQILMDSTYTIKLPQTERNKAIMKYLHEADMNTDFPYTIHKADYIVDGMQIIRNGEVKVLGDFELQVVYGIDKSLFSNFITKLLLESVDVGDDIWLHDWRQGVSTAGKKFKFINYVSVERESDALIVSGVTQPPIEVPVPYTEHSKLMTIHPFVYFRDIIDLINNDNGNIFNFTELKNRLSERGLIIGNKKSKYNFQEQKIFDNETVSGTGLTGINLDIFGSESFPLSIFLTEIQDLPEISNQIGSYTFSFYLNFKITNNVGDLYFKIKKSGIEIDSILIPKTTETGKLNYATTVFYEKKENDAVYTYSLMFENSVSSYTITKNEFTTGVLFYNLKTNNSFYSIYSTNIIPGIYDVKTNLPEMKQIEFIKEMLIISGLNMSYDSNGLLKTYSLDEFKQNYVNGSVYDWSGKISNVKNSKYQFNSNAQSNWIKFVNSDSMLYLSKDKISVNDLTVQNEKTLYDIKFNLSEMTNNGLIENIMYTQKVAIESTGNRFSNEYKEKPSVIAVNKFDKGLSHFGTLPNTVSNTKNISGLIIRVTDNSFTYEAPETFEDTVRLFAEQGNKLLSLYDYETETTETFENVYITHRIGNICYLSDNILTKFEYRATFDNYDYGFVDLFYSVYQKLINRPIVKECNVLLDFYESAKIDFTKPIYIAEWGKYCMLLELTAPNNGLCEAKLLLINQTL